MNVLQNLLQTHYLKWTCEDHSVQLDKDRTTWNTGKHFKQNLYLNAIYLVDYMPAETDDSKQFLNVGLGAS